MWCATQCAHSSAHAPCAVMSRRVELVVAPTTAEPSTLPVNDPLTYAAENAQLKYNNCIDGICKRIEKGVKEESALAPIVPYDPRSDALNQCMIVDEQNRPMPLHLCPTVLDELDLPRASMGVSRAKLAYACPFSKPPLYHCSAITIKEGGFAKRRCTFRPQVASNERALPAMLLNVTKHLETQHGITTEAHDTDIDKRDYLLLEAEGFVV